MLKVVDSENSSLAFFKLHFTVTSALRSSVSCVRGGNPSSPGPASPGAGLPGKLREGGSDVGAASSTEG